MIRINLLAGPRARKAKGQWDVQLELAVAVVLVVVTLGACLFYLIRLDNQIEAREVVRQEKNVAIAKLRDQVKKVEKFETRKKHLENLNLVIERLEKNRKGPVHVLDFLSHSLEPVKVWLVKLSLKGNRVNLSGVALVNEDVVGFINNLRSGDQVADVRLREIRAGKEATVKVFKFQLDLALTDKEKKT